MWILGFKSMIGKLQYKLRKYGERWVFLGNKIENYGWVRGSITGTGESSMEK